MQYCDLFSGIGGISLALKDFVKTVLYCEQDKYCQEVLIARMNDGNIDQAPIHNDVRTLHLGAGCQPVMIGGGFPCQDISLAGVQKGIVGGERSSLFFEIMRLVDENSCIQYVFLENVPNIVKCGMKEVVEALDARGFNFQWTMKSAGGCGAPHLRNRWFMLAYRGGAAVGSIAPEKTTNMWTEEPASRVSFKPVSGIEDASFDANWIQRCQALGNTVVPCIVRSAFIELWNGMLMAEKVMDCLGNLCACDLSNMDYPYPESGMVLNKKYIGIPKAASVGVKSCVKITVRNEDVCNFPTPRRGITHASAITERSLHDLPTVLINSDQAIAYIQTRMVAAEVPEKLMSIVTPNVNYIEWMMGYKADWTRVATVSKAANITEKKRTASTTVGVVDVKKKYNGMHVFMKENPGKDVRTIAAMWRALAPEARLDYTAKLSGAHASACRGTLHE